VVQELQNAELGRLPLPAVEFRLSFGCDFTTRFFEENPLIAAILLAVCIIRRF